MRFAFIYGPHFLTYRRFDFQNVWDDPRGLTGSELSYLKVAKAMRSLGHEVHLYTLFDGAGPGVWEDLSVHPYEELGKDGLQHDVAVSWHEANPLRLLDPSTFRIVSIQINSLHHCYPDADSYVDVWASPSRAHVKMMTESGISIGNQYGMATRYSPTARWEVIPHGCECESYDRLFEAGLRKVPGRVIWASSPDRGLHWLLQEWPKIRRAAPHAHLRIFYRLDAWLAHMGRESFDVEHGPDILEQMRRALYIGEAMRRLRGHGVEVMDSVSRNRIDLEMAEAEVMAYSCDTVLWTEGFSVSLMEGCGARACPITTSVDALPDVYGGVIPMVALPVKEHVGEFSDLVVRALTNPSYRGEVNARVHSFAKERTWTSIARRYEEVVSQGRRRT